MLLISQPILGFIYIPSVHKYVKTHPISFFLNNCNQGEQSLEGSACFGRACNGIWDKKFWNRSGASGSQKNRPYGGMLGENAALFEELYSTVQSSTFIHMEDTHARMHGQSSKWVIYFSHIYICGYAEIEGKE